MTTVLIETGVWRPIPPGPLSPREGALGFWTGEELVIVGGIDDDPCLPTREGASASGFSAFRSAALCVPGYLSVLADGAAFDPDTGTWRQIAPAPVPLTAAGPGVVHDGVIYILVGGQPETFLAYHPADDRWEHLPPPATRNGTLVEAGDKVALVKNQDPEGDPDLWLEDPDRGVAPDMSFNPATKDWHAIPPDPLIPSWDRSLVWTGTELVLLGAEAVPQPGSEAPAFMRAAAYDPKTGTWRRLPDSDLVIAGGYGTWYLRNGLLINPSLGSADGGSVNPYDRAYPFGGMLDLESGQWSPLLNPPPEPLLSRTFVGYTAPAPELYLVGNGWLFEPATGRWQSLPAPPDDSALGIPRHGSVVLFAGPDLVVWGGFLYGDDGRGEMVSTGWMWRPER